MQYRVIGLLVVLLYGAMSAQPCPGGQFNGGYMGNGITAPSGLYAGAGIGSLSNLAEDNPSYQAFVGTLWGMSPMFSFKAQVDATYDFDESLLLAPVVGINFYPVEAGWSPYIGAGAGVGYARWGSNLDVLGFNLSGVFGVLFFRTSPVRITLETKGDFLFREIDQIGGNMPMAFVGRIGFLF